MASRRVALRGRKTCSVRLFKHFMRYSSGFRIWVQDHGINPLRHTLGSPRLCEARYHSRPNRLRRPTGVAIGHDQDGLRRGPLFGRCHDQGGHVGSTAAAQFDLLWPEYVLGAGHGSITGQHAQAAGIGQGTQCIADHAQCQGKAGLCHAAAGVDDDPTWSLPWAFITSGECHGTQVNQEPCRSWVWTSRLRGQSPLCPCPVG